MLYQRRHGHDVFLYRQIGLLRRPGLKDRETVKQSLAHAAVDGLTDRPFRDLSGGQKQRVLIARALATQPEVLILDEPTNGMDLPSRISVLELIHELHQEEKLTVIMISHLLDDVANHVRRIALVEPNFFQIGHVDEVLTAKNLSQAFGGQVFFIDGAAVVDQCCQPESV